MNKIKMIDDHNKDYKSLPCGYTMIGNEKKRKLLSKLHVKTCELCKSIKDKSDLYKLTPDLVSNDKMNLVDYMKGKYIRDYDYIIEK